MLLVCRLDWHVSPLRGQRWLEVWEIAAAKCSAFWAKSWSLTRGDEDPLGFQLTTVWESKADFERFWFSRELEEAREATIGWYNIPILPTWHTLIASESIVASGA